MFSQFFSILCVLVNSALGYHVSEELKMDPDQTKLFSRFRDMSNSFPIDNPLMKQDAYLVKVAWERNFSVNGAEDLLKHIIEFRGVKNIAENQKKDFSDMQKDYPYTLTNVDKEGRPILFTPGGQHDFQKTLHTDRKSRLFDHVYAAWEVASNLALGKVDKDISRWIFLIDLHGFKSLQGILCKECMEFYTEISKEMQNQWPMMIEKIIFVNASPIFQAVHLLLKSNWKKSTNQDTMYFDEDAKKFKAYLLTIMDEDQIPDGLYLPDDQKKGKLTTGLGKVGGLLKKQ